MLVIEFFKYFYFKQIKKKKTNIDCLSILNKFCSFTSFICICDHKPLIRLRNKHKQHTNKKQQTLNMSAPEWDKVSVEDFDEASQDEYEPRECWQCMLPFQHGDLTILLLTFEERYHLNCYTESDNFILHNCPPSTSQLKNYKFLTRIQKNKINKVLFPKMILSKLRFQINIFKDINDMNKQELMTLCKMMDLNAYKETPASPQFNIKRAKKKIQRYFSHKTRKIKIDCLVYGYCKESERLLSLTIPNYLSQIIRLFYPMFN